MVQKETEIERENKLLPQKTALKLTSLTDECWKWENEGHYE